MGITFQARIDTTHYTEKKVFLCERYPTLDESDFSLYGSLYDEEAGKHYDIERCVDFPYQLSLSNSNFYQLLEIIDTDLALYTQKNNGYGELENKDLDHFHQKLVHALNTLDASNTRIHFLLARLTAYGIGMEYIVEHLNMFKDIVESAKLHNLDIQWG